MKKFQDPAIRGKFRRLLAMTQRTFDEHPDRLQLDIRPARDHTIIDHLEYQIDDIWIRSIPIPKLPDPPERREEITRIITAQIHHFTDLVDFTLSPKLVEYMASRFAEQEP